MDWEQFKVVILLLTHSVFSVSVEGKCEFNVNQEVSNEPLVLYKKVRGNSYELVQAEECNLNIDTNQNLLLACPGNGNFLNYTKDSTNVVKCLQSNNFELNGKSVSYNEIVCSKRPDADLQNTNKKCFKNVGAVIYAGFKVENEWYPLLEICHDKQKSHTYYVKHKLIVPPISCPKTPNTRPGFTETGQYPDLNMEEIYSTKYQLSVFEKLMGSKANDYINRDDNKYLARGHLAPDADFPLDAWKTLTYFYVNTAPQWQSINAGSWVSLEKNIRKLSSKITQLDVITGTHGILKLENMEIYLGTKKLPVPEYIWKLIHNPADHSCMGFVSKNTPFLKRNPRHICENVCTRYGWNIGSGDLFNGYTYCCEYHHLSKVIQEVPNIRCTSALRFF